MVLLLSQLSNDLRNSDVACGRPGAHVPGIGLPLSIAHVVAIVAAVATSCFVA